jgi:hypothetical protein
MKFLYPQFLYALAVVAIPIILHLFNFKKFKTVYFSNVRFLKEVKQQTKAQSELKHILILLSRILALSSLVLAFAQPYVPKKNMELANKHAISVFVDNSFSMNAQNANGQLLQEALQKTESISEAYQTVDDFHIITNDLSAQHQRLITKEAFLEELGNINSTSNTSLLSKVVNRQKQAIGKSDADQKTIYLISDFQSNKFDLDSWEIDTNLSIRLIPIEAYQLNNLYIDSCWLNTPSPQKGQNIKLSARVKNIGQERKNSSVKLIINGQQKAIANTDVNGEAIVDLNFMCEEDQWQDANLIINDYPITFDNSFFASFEIKKNINVQVIYEESTSSSLKKLFATDPFFSFSEQSLSRINHSDLFNQQLLILDELKSISSGLSESIQKFVANGGTLLVLPNEKSNLNNYKNLLNSLKTDYYTTLDKEPIRVVKLHENHKLFEGVFEKLSEKIDFPKISQFFTNTTLSKTSASAVLTLENGQALISEYTYEKGKVYLSSIGLNNVFGNFNKHALFVPILYNMAIQSSGKQDLYHPLSTPFVTTERTLSQTETYTIEGEDFSFIPSIQNKQIGIYNQIKEAGHYHLKDKMNKKISSLAFNYARTESNPTTLPIDKLEEFASKHKNIEVIADANETLSQTINPLNTRTTLWKLCIIFALGFLALETLIIRRL